MHSWQAGVQGAGVSSAAAVFTLNPAFLNCTAAPRWDTNYHCSTKRPRVIPDTFIPVIM